jgi:Tol biopolymer transport system component
LDALEQLTTALAGRYAVDREIGRGGMATVYLARDVRHERQVAIKVVDAELGAVLGGERFLAEIKVTANLQHPNLLPLFDSGEAGGQLFYVMPFVEGESLRVRLNREKQLPVEEAIRIATAVANALDYAHSHGVIHRDLKPENILMQAGQPVVADFGIALAVSKAGGARITQTGISLGTPQYMSPEQATGDRAVDGRTDIYSLGALTYEMLTGEPPHVGATSQTIIAKLLTEDVRPVAVLRRSVPPHVDAAVRQALQKLPADRIPTGRDFVDALHGRGAFAQPGVSGAVKRDGPASRGLRRISPREIAAWTVAAAAIATSAMLLATRQGSNASTVRFTINVPKDERVFTSAAGNLIAISPSGDVVAYETLGPAGQRLYTRRAGELGSRLLSSGGGIRSLSFSPDGRWIAFTIGAVLHKIPADGGPTIELGRVPYPIFGASWAVPDSIVIGTNGGIFVLPAAGGQARHAVVNDTSKNAQLHYWPLALPDGEHVVFASYIAAGGGSLGVASLKTGKSTPLNVRGVAPVGIVNGHLVYAVASGSLMAVPFNERNATLAGSGTPVPVVENVVVDVAGSVKASMGRSGNLVYVSGRSESMPVLVGERSLPRPLIGEARSYSNPRFAPDGRRVAFSITGTTSTEIWMYDRDKGTLGRLTSDGPNLRPEWTQDGKRVVFRSELNSVPGVSWQSADGSGDKELIYRPDDAINEALISPDGKWLVYRTAPGTSHTQDIFAVPMQGDRKPVPLVTGPLSELMPRVSPDSRWMAYQSNETDVFEVYVRPFPGAGARVQVSTKGGSEPLWAHSGRTLYYRRGSELVAVPVTLGATFSMGEPRVVLSGDYLTDATHPGWDVSPDGSQFLMLQRAGEEPKIVVVHDWAQELAQRLGVKGRD